MGNDNLGTKDFEDLGYKLEWDKDSRTYSCFPEKGGHSSRLTFDPKDSVNVETLYNGWFTIKNKRKLKRLLKQLGIL